MDSPRSKIAEIISQYCKQLGKMGIHVEKTILFGSHANGVAREDSDIDLLIVSSDFESMNTLERLELLGIAAARIWQPVEAVGYTPGEMAHVEPATLMEEILKTGIAIG